MFGYVVPLKGELKVKEYDLFKAYYCGLCRAIGDKSLPSRFTLTYDMTFLGLLLSSVYLEGDISLKRICYFKMKPVMSIEKNKYIEYAADMNIILSNRKLLDDYADDGNYTAFLLSKVIKTKRPSDMARNKIAQIDEKIESLNLAEKNKGGIDEAAHCFAELTGEIFNVGESGHLLKIMGYNLGKWIYTIDAYDDIEEDLRKGRYNPCVITYNFENEGVVEFKNRIRENMEFTLIKCLDEMAKVFDLLSIKKNRGLLENVLYLGLERTTMARFEGGCNYDKSIPGTGLKGRCFPGGSKASL